MQGSSERALAIAVLLVSTTYYKHICIRASISITPSLLFAVHLCIWCATHSYATYYIRWVVSRRQLTATHCNTLQHVSCTRKHLVGHTLQHIANIATHPNTLQHALANLNRKLQQVSWVSQGSTFATLRHTTTYYNTPQHTAAQCNALQQLKHIATYCNILQHITAHYSTLQHTSPGEFYNTTPREHHTQHTTHCNTLQHTATNCNTLQHTATHHRAPHSDTLRHTVTH